MTARIQTGGADLERPCNQSASSGVEEEHQGGACEDPERFRPVPGQVSGRAATERLGASAVTGPTSSSAAG